jgi:hypothetical protein
MRLLGGQPEASAQQIDDHLPLGGFEAVVHPGGLDKQCRHGEAQIAIIIQRNAPNAGRQQGCRAIEPGREAAALGTGHQQDRLWPVR